MATKAAIVARRAATEPARPYPPGWLHRLLAWIERLPGPPWAWYVLAGVAASLVYHLEFWTSGRSAYGQVDVENTFWGIVVFVALWASAHFERVASAAALTTRPALRLDDDAFERLRYELAVAPAVPSAIALAAAAGLSALGMIVDPEGSVIVGVPALVVVAAFFVGVLYLGILFVVLLQLVRQMRIIRTTLDRSAVVDVFLPGPLSGFSRLTSQVGITIVLVIAAASIITPVPADPLAYLVRGLPFVLIPPGIALLAFVLPLYGFHTRLESEKQRLRGEAEHRLKALLGALNEDLDRRDLTRAEGLNQQLVSMLQQREVLAKLPTWPWSTGTFRGFISAILLPMVLFLIQGVLSQALFR